MPRKAGLPETTRAVIAQRRQALHRPLIDPAGDPNRITLEVSPAVLAAHPDNIRGDDLGDITELKENIRANGVRVHLIVTPVDAHLAAYPHHQLVLPPDARYVVTAGHRRRAALLQLLEDATAEGTAPPLAPVIIRQDPPSLAEDLVLMYAENGFREGVTPVAEARMIQRLMDDAGISGREVGRRLGIPAATIAKRRKLLQLPPEAQAALSAGRMTLTAAEQLLEAGGRAGEAWRLYSAVAGPHAGNAADAAAAVRLPPLPPAPAGPVIPRPVPSPPGRPPDSGPRTVRDRPPPQPPAAAAEPPAPPLDQRTAYAAQIAVNGAMPGSADRIAQLSDAVLRLAPNGAAVQLAHSWFAANDPAIPRRPGDWARLTADNGGPDANRAAWAVVVAAGELAPDGSPQAAAHLRRLHLAGWRPPGDPNRITPSAAASE